MQKILLAVVVGTASMALAGCLTGVERLIKRQLDAELAVDFDAKCRPRFVILTHRANVSVDVHPPYLEVCAGQTVTVLIFPRVNQMVNPAQSISGSPSAPWLSGTSLDGNVIVLTVPPNASPTPSDEPPLKYSLQIQGIAMIDPTIRIIQ